MATQSIVDSPVRRSSRLKQTTKIQKHSPDSGSDTSTSTSTSSSQPVRARQQTATMDSTSTETLRSSTKKSRAGSVSPEVSEIDVDVGTPRRITRSSLAGVIPGTPTRANVPAARYSYCICTFFLLLFLAE